MVAQSSEQIIAAAILEQRRRAANKYTVVGFIDPIKGFTHALSNKTGAWAITQEEAEIFFPAKLEPLLTVDKRFKIVIGGRGSGKSQTMVGMNLIDSQDKGIKTGCFREFQNSIEDSVHSLMCREIKRLKLTGFNTQNNKIENSSGGIFKFRGLARNPSSMQSMDGFERFHVEEAQTLSAESLKLMVPTLREEGSELWCSANPMSRADPFSQRFIVPFEKELDRDGYYEDDLHLIIRCNYTDNPFFPDVLEKDRQFDFEHLSTEEYEHIWEGKYNDSVPGSIIPVKWFNACIDAHDVLGIQPVGAIVVTHDPSDEGPDPKGLCKRHGSIVLDIQEKDDGDATEGSIWACKYAIEHRADVYRWDCDGLGVVLKASVATELDGKGIEVDMFRGSNSPENPEDIYQPDHLIDRDNAKTNKQTFKNQRAQFYFMLRDRMYNTFRAITQGLYIDPELMLSISSKIELIDRLRTEVCRIPKKQNANGLLQIMSKEDMARQSPPIASPNLADSLMMSMKTHTRNQQFKQTARQVATQSAAGWT